MMKIKLFHTIPLILFLSGCNSGSSPVSPSESGIYLRVQPSVVNENGTGSRINVSIQNLSPNPIYCTLFDNRVEYSLWMATDASSWIDIGSLPITDISQVKRISSKEIKPGFSYQDTLSLSFGSGMKLSTSIVVASDSLWEEDLTSNVF
jgi:hypothetical protein